MSDELKVGDIVSLKTGGPEMIVTSVVRTPNDTVLIGCAPLRAPTEKPIEVSMDRLISIN
ncbi:Uncharacterized small protein [Kaistia soli DSM 19436]|uniref:Uncharacterized small protein n=1 Tax=Kaistia soli DSM 19436 TaxID=1122133 RepID=A0A1M4Y0W4_9HYPH|nr:DUF2158 domain-containing protein [Kaistia soli]SHE99381.1 Uncharacterized small protein [Kaistia soli DSM 19436]